MRLHCDSQHPDWKPEASRARIFLAGSERSNVIWADEEGRRAIVIALDAEGKPKLTGPMHDLAYEEFVGDVRIVIDPPHMQDVALADPTYYATGGKPFLDVDLSCGASGAGHSYGAHGPKGEEQCAYCGEPPPSLAQQGLDLLEDAWKKSGGYGGTVERTFKKGERLPNGSIAKCTTIIPVATGGKAVFHAALPTRNHAGDLLEFCKLAGFELQPYQQDMLDRLYAKHKRGEQHVEAQFVHDEVQIRPVTGFGGDCIAEVIKAFDTQGPAIPKDHKPTCITYSRAEDGVPMRFAAGYKKIKPGCIQCARSKCDECAPTRGAVGVGTLKDQFNTSGLDANKWTMADPASKGLATINFADGGKLEIRTGKPIVMQNIDPAIGSDKTAIGLGQVMDADTGRVMTADEARRLVGVDIFDQREPRMHRVGQKASSIRYVSSNGIEDVARQIRMADKLCYLTMNLEFSLADLRRNFGQTVQRIMDKMGDLLKEQMIKHGYVPNPDALRGLRPKAIVFDEVTPLKRPGETLGHGEPDWPADLTTYAERSAYQRGIADARAQARKLADDDEDEKPVAGKAYPVIKKHKLAALAKEVINTYGKDEVLEVLACFHVKKFAHLPVGRWNECAAMLRDVLTRPVPDIAPAPTNPADLFTEVFTDGNAAPLWPQKAIPTLGTYLMMDKRLQREVLRDMRRAFLGKFDKIADRREAGTMLDETITKQTKSVGNRLSLVNLRDEGYEFMYRWLAERIAL